MSRKLRKKSTNPLFPSWFSVWKSEAVAERFSVVGKSAHTWAVWLITLVYTQLQFLSQLTTGVMADAFTHTFQLNSLSLGLLVASYYFTYVPMQGPAGMLLDRYGPRVLLSGGALVFALGSLMLADAPGLPMAIFGRMVMGIGASFAFIGCINTASRWFPRHLIVMLTSVLELTGIASVLLGDRLLPTGLEIYGWRPIMMVSAAIAAICGIIIWAIVRNESPYMQAKVKKPCYSRNVIHRMGWKKCLFAISRRKAMWVNGFYCGVIFSFVSVFSALWGIPYLQHVKGLALASASNVDNWLLFGVLIGCAIMIVVQKKIKNDLAVMRNVAMIMGVISISVIFYAHMPIWAIELSLFLLGVLSPVYLLCFKVCALLLPDSLRASSTGFTNMMMMAIAPAFQLVFAGVVMLAAFGMRYFHAEQIGMLLFPILIFIAGFWIKKIRIPKNRPMR